MLLDDMSYSRINNDDSYTHKKKTGMGICVGLEFSINMTNKLLGLAGYTLLSGSREAFTYLLTY